MVPRARATFNPMVKQTPGSLDRVFQALADPTRRAILERLAASPGTVTELSEPFQLSLAAVSKHLRRLERAGLVEREVVGREHHMRLRPETLADAWDWLAFHERFWNERLDALEQVLGERRATRATNREEDRT